MELIKLTRVKNNSIAYVKASSISAVSQEEGYTKVFIFGDPIPFEVTQSIYEVITMIQQADFYAYHK